jgi:hypothetical protein
MGSRNHSKSDALIRQRIKKVILQKHRERFGVDAVVHIEQTGYRNHLDLLVTSPKFARIPCDEGVTLVMDWITEVLPPRVHSRIVGLMTLSPAQERRLFGRAV